MSLYYPKRILKQDPTVVGNYNKVSPWHYNIEAINRLNDRVSTLSESSSSNYINRTLTYDDILGMDSNTSTWFELLPDSEVASDEMIILNRAYYKYTYGGSATFSTTGSKALFIYTSNGNIIASTTSILDKTTSGFSTIGNTNPSYGTWPAPDSGASLGYGLKIGTGNAVAFSDGDVDTTVEFKIFYSKFSFDDITGATL